MTESVHVQAKRAIIFADKRCTRLGRRAAPVPRGRRAPRDTRDCAPETRTELLLGRFRSSINHSRGQIRNRTRRQNLLEQPRAPPPPQMATTTTTATAIASTSARRTRAAACDTRTSGGATPAASRATAGPRPSAGAAVAPLTAASSARNGARRRMATLKKMRVRYVQFMLNR